jgi:hypothetical protein
MRQARRREIDSRAGHHPVLDRNVVEMMILNLGCGFNFDQSPALVFATLQDIYPDEDSIVFEDSFKDRTGRLTCIPMSPPTYESS